MGNVIPLARAGAPSTIPEREVTVEGLRRVLDAGYVDHELDDDGEIYVTEFDFPFWIQIMSRHRLLKLTTFFPVDDQPEVDWTARVNVFNSRIEMAQFCYLDHGVCCSYWMTYDGGLNPRQSLRQMRRFTAAVVSAITMQRDDAQTCRPRG